MENGEVCWPERDVVRRLRKELGLSHKTLGELARVFQSEVRTFEEKRVPLSHKERGNMVALLTAMLSITRVDYATRIKAWRKRRGLGMRVAAELAGLSYKTWFRVEHNQLTRGLQEETKSKLDAVMA